LGRLMKILQKAKTSGELNVRSFPAVEKKKKSPYLRIKCFDCINTLEIHYDIIPGPDQDFEINGVYGTKKEWLKILKLVGLM
jgi:hypothetical protein